MADIFALFEQIKTKNAGLAPTGPVEWIVAALGNPGLKYEGTRHNVGFAAADYTARKRNFEISRIRFQGTTGECMMGEHHVLFLKPSTFMNLSGQSVLAAMQFYKIPAERVVVIHDDISLEPGRLRIREKGSAGGHNGLKDIILKTGKDTFPRIKIGVGKKPYPDYDLADWVLSRPADEDKKRIEDAITRADEALYTLITQNAQEAMSRFNR